MQINLYHQPKDNTSLLNRIARRTADRVIHCFEYTLSKLSLDKNRHLILSYSLQHPQNSEALLDCVMQLNCIYQSHDLNAILGENNAS